jgi:membrane associated rhomboid family serine protease
VKYSFEIFQWFTSTLLIPEFSGLIVALFLILTCYSTLEANYGYKFAISLYFLSGVSGALFGDVCNMC